MHLMKTLTSVALAVALVASDGACAEEVSLSCWGTVALIQQGRQVNPVDEQSSLAVTVDVTKKTITINGVMWLIAGDASGDTIVSMDENKGSATLNRVTGAVSVHFIEYSGLKTFYGQCKPAQKLF